MQTKSYFNFLFKFIFLLISAVLISYTIHSFSIIYSSSNSYIENLWSNDIKLLKQYKIFPKEWGNISSIQLIPGDTESKKIIDKKINIPITINKSGNFHLEVLLLIFYNEDLEKNVIIQYSLINKNTDNLEWELGRTLNIKQPTFESEFINPIKKFLNKTK